MGEGADRVCRAVLHHDATSIFLYHHHPVKGPRITDVTAPVFTVREVRLYEREVRLRLPFRFGVVTLTQAPQVFVRARIELPDGSSHWGAAAELLAPKWFDKNLALTNEENFEQLRLALALAREAYLADTRSHSAFLHAASCYPALIDRGGLQGL